MHNTEENSMSVKRRGTKGKYNTCITFICIKYPQKSAGETNNFGCLKQEELGVWGWDLDRVS